MNDSRKEDLALLISQVTKEGSTGIVSPYTHAELAKDGIKLPISNELSVDEFIDSCFSVERREAARELANSLPELTDVPIPSVRSLYDEIRSAVVFGLNGAAITLSGILVEHIIKYATYAVEMGGFARYDAAKMDEFERLTLGPAIDRAFAVSILTSEDVQRIKDFKDRCRNPYNHYNLKKIAGNAEAPITTIDTNDLTYETQQVKAADSPVLQVQVKPLIDAQIVFSVITFAVSVVKTLWERIKSESEDGEYRHEAQ